MSDREGSHKGMDRDHSPRRDDLPRNHKDKSYSRSPSRERRVRDLRREDRYRDRGDRDYSSRSRHDRSPSRERRGRDRRREDRCSCRSRLDRSPRSRSRSDRRRKSSRYSRSYSRSPSSASSDRGSAHPHSHSPMSSRRRHTGTRDNPKPFHCHCLGVFGLSVYTTEDDLYQIMSKYGPVESVQVVIDSKTGRSRGFAFVYFENTDDAKLAKEQCTGMKINDKNIRVDFSIAQRARTPTPGINMRKPT